MESTFESAVKRLIQSLSTEEAQYITPADACIRATAEAVKENKCVLMCGNGGSAATATHIANDLLCHMKNWNRRGYRMLSLADNVAALTSMTNDYGFAEVFSKQVAVFGEKGGVLWAFSTSGNSVNCVNAVKQANEMGMISVGFTGRSGGKMKDLCGIWVPVDSEEVTRVEELHMIYAHIIGENIERIVSPADD